jgi:hypothetical protein
MKKYTSKQYATGFSAYVCNSDKRNTGFKIVVPYSSPKRVCIGSTGFDIVQDKAKYYAIADKPLSFHWFTNLNRG